MHSIKKQPNGKIANKNAHSPRENVKVKTTEAERFFFYQVGGKKRRRKYGMFTMRA